MLKFDKWSIAFGAAFGNTAFSYFSLLISSLNLIFGKWLGLVR
jgi:hypothetical protein